MFHFLISISLLSICTTLFSMEQAIIDPQKGTQKNKLDVIGMKKLIRKDDESKNIKNYFKHLDKKIASYVLHDSAIVHYIMEHYKPKRTKTLSFPISGNKYKISPDGTKIILSSQRLITILSTDTLQEISTINCLNNSAKWLNNNRVYINQVGIFDIEKNAILHNTEHLKKPLYISPLYDYFITASDIKNCSSIDTKTLEEIQTITIDRNICKSIHGNHDGSIIAIETDRSSIEFFSMPSGNKIKEIQNISTIRYDGHDVIALTKDKMIIRTGFGISFLTVYDIKSGKIISNNRMIEKISRIYKNPFNENHILFSLRDGTGILFDIEKKLPIVEIKHMFPGTKHFVRWIDEQNLIIGKINITAGFSHILPQAYLYNFESNRPLTYQFIDYFDRVPIKDIRSLFALTIINKNEIVIACNKKLEHWYWNAAGMQDYLENKLPLESALLLLAIEKTHASGQLYEMDEASLQIFNKLDKKVQEILTPLITGKHAKITNYVTTILNKCAII